MRRVAFALSTLVISAQALAQTPSSSPAQVEQLVERISLFSDPLLAQVLAAVTFADQIPAAAQWAQGHRDLSGQVLASEMLSRRLLWDPSVQALLPFPSLLEQMARDPHWTESLGQAFLAQEQDVLNAIQAQRAKAIGLDLLRTDDHVTVDRGADIRIMPSNPAYIFVPSYDPHSSGPAIRYGEAVHVGGFQPFGWSIKKSEVLGGYFQAWGWGLGGIDWATRTVIINDMPWGRTWENRREYVHSYPDLNRTAVH